MFLKMMIYQSPNPLHKFEIVKNKHKKKVGACRDCQFCKHDNTPNYENNSNGHP